MGSKEPPPRVGAAPAAGPAAPQSSVSALFTLPRPSWPGLHHSLLLRGAVGAVETVPSHCGGSLVCRRHSNQTDSPTNAGSVPQLERVT